MVLQEKLSGILLQGKLHEFTDIYINKRLNQQLSEI